MPVRRVGAVACVALAAIGAGAGAAGAPSGDVRPPVVDLPVLGPRGEPPPSYGVVPPAVPAPERGTVRGRAPSWPSWLVKVRARRGGRWLVGSGFTPRPGLVITAYHVVRRAGALTVEGPGGRRVRARLRAVDPREDLAALTLPADTRARALPLAAADAPRGSLVRAFGFPYGQLTRAAGRVIALRGEQAVGPSRVFAFSARVLPGFSGGPVVNRAGLVTGLVVARDAGFTTAFAVTAGAARRLLRRV